MWHSFSFLRSLTLLLTDECFYPQWALKCLWMLFFTIPIPGQLFPLLTITFKPILPYSKVKTRFLSELDWKNLYGKILERHVRCLFYVALSKFSNVSLSVRFFYWQVIFTYLWNVIFQVWLTRTSGKWWVCEEV